jgi:tetratricopeptide (TPR) repeat protein
VNPLSALSRSRKLRWLAVCLLLGLIGVGLWVGGRAALAEYYLRQGEQALHRQRYPEAREALGQALRLRPGSAKLHLLAARAARLTGDFQSAREHLAQCPPSMQANSEDLRLEEYMLRAQMGELDETLYVLLAYVEEERPQTPLVLEALARAATTAYRSGLAWQCLERWLRLQPDSSEAHFRRGLWYALHQDTKAAADDYGKALEIDPERTDIRLALAENLRENAKFDKAAEQYRSVLRQEAGQVAARTGLARCCLELGRLSEARSLLDGLSEQEQESAEALWVRAWLALNDGRLPEAEHLLRGAVGREPGNREARYQLALCLRRLGKVEEARRQEEGIKQLDEDTKHLLAITNTEMNAAPRNPALPCELGEIYLRLGVTGRGLYWLHHALELAPDFRPAHERLLRYYESLGPTGREQAAHHRRQLARTTDHPRTAEGAREGSIR